MTVTGVCVYCALYHYFRAYFYLLKNFTIKQYAVMCWQQLPISCLCNTPCDVYKMMKYPSNVLKCQHSYPKTHIGYVITS
jgi:hypothetical protein